MKFVDNLIKARGHLVIIFGVIAAAVIIYLSGEFQQSHAPRQGGEPRLEISFSSTKPVRDPRPLTPEEQEFAKTAWQYFVNNYQESTGLVNSVDQYPATTLWDTASYLYGLSAAYELEVIGLGEFTSRLEALLGTLARLPLNEQGLPNKSYHTETGAMSTYDNSPTETGIGTSTLDSGRMLSGLIYINRAYPEYSTQVAAVLRHLKLEHIMEGGELLGYSLVDEQLLKVQEGRLGYEEYAARGFILAGGDAYRAFEYKDYLGFTEIYGVKVPHDTRSPAELGARTWVVSEPYILDLIEYGGDHISREFAYRVFLAQARRYEETGIFTAVTETHLDRAPYFIYNSVIENGIPWASTLEDGTPADEHKTLSTKAAFGWYALYNTQYTKALLDHVKSFHDPKRGWYSGWYEVDQKLNKSLTSNTNGIILESLHYIQYGKFIKFASGM